jgi:hypothetical protein
MRINGKFFSRIVFFLLSNLAAIPLYAQDSLRLNDSANVPQGIIHVAKPPVPAAFYYKMQYAYPEYSKGRKTNTRMDGGVILVTDSLRQVKHAQVALDFGVESFRLSSSDTTNYFRDGISWDTYLRAMNYSFSRSDTSRGDSACVVFAVNKKGETSMRLIPWAEADSTCRAFEAKTSEHLGHLRTWKPAQVLKKRKKKAKTITSMVIVTVYAYDPTQGRFMPIEDKVIGGK